MSHICVYLGKGGCPLKIPFRYLEITGWSQSFENPLMHTTLDRALLAPHSPLYRQPLVYIPCKNESKLSTDVSMGYSFLGNAWRFHFLRIASYFDCVVCLHDSVIISAISSGVFLFQIVSLIIEQLAASTLVIMGVLLVCLMAKLTTLSCLVAELGSLAKFSASTGPDLGLPPRQNYDPTCLVVSYFCQCCTN